MVCLKMHTNILKTVYSPSLKQGWQTTDFYFYIVLVSSAM